MIKKIITNLCIFLKPRYKQRKRNQGKYIPQSEYIPESHKRYLYLCHWYPNLFPGETIEWMDILVLSIAGCSSGNLHDPRLVYFTSERIIWRFYGRETGWEPFTEIPYSEILYIRRSLGSFLGFRSDNANELYVNNNYGVHFISYNSDLSRCEQIIKNASSFHGKVEAGLVFNMAPHKI
jgi:hypothetical protein